MSVEGPKANRRILRRPEVEARCGFKRAHLYKLIDEGQVSSPGADRSPSSWLGLNRDRAMDRRPAAAAELTVADIHARDVTPATITVAEIQGCRDARLPLTVALIAIRLHAFLRERIAGSMTLEPGSAAEFAIYARRLF